jgi:hypothetical protein
LDDRIVKAMDTVWSTSETSVNFYQTTRCYNPEIHSDFHVTRSVMICCVFIFKPNLWFHFREI